MGRIRKLLIAVSSLILVSSSFFISVPNIIESQTVSAVTENLGPSLMSLGASLDSQQAERTKQLLGASDVTAENTIRVDGVMVNRYLNDGSNASTGVYSSAYIKPQAANYGVQVQIVTPQNITKVSPATYQNAAITAGAKDVLVRVATVTPVTGEGALAGVYALLEESGVTLNPRDIQIANQEITLINEIHNHVTINNYTVNKMITNIKIQIIEQKNININLTADDIYIIVINQLQQNGVDAQLNNELLQKLLEFAKNFVETEAASNPDTIDQLELSIIGNNWAEVLSNQEGSMTFQEALSLERPDYSNSVTYHPIIQAMLDRVYHQYEKEEYAGEIYSHTFIVEAILPNLSTDELAALNYIRTLIYQVQASSEDEATSPIKSQWLLALNRDLQLQLEPALYELFQRIAISTGFAPEAFTYSDWHQDGNLFTVTITNDWTPQQQILGYYSIDMTNHQIYIYDQGAGEIFGDVLPTVIDFEGLYGVAVEYQEFDAVVPEEYEVPEEESYLEEHDEPFIENLPEEIPEETPSTEESVESDLPSEESTVESEVDSEVSEESQATEGEMTETTETTEPTEEESSDIPAEESTSDSIEETVTDSVEESTEVPAEEATSDPVPIPFPDFNQSWKEILESTQEGPTMTIEDIEAMEYPDYTNRSIYHPIIPAMYNEFKSVVTNRHPVQEVMSHTFIYEDMTPNISNEEKAALNQLRWLALQYFLNEFEDERNPEFGQYNLPYREELIRRINALEQLSQDPNMKEIYAVVSQATGMSALAYAIDIDLIELEEQFYQVFYFWLDGYPPTEYPAAYYSFSDGTSGILGLGNYIEAPQPFNFYNEYGLDVVNNYQPSTQIQIPAEVQQRMQEIEMMRQAEEQSRLDEEMSIQESINQEMNNQESASPEEEFIEDPSSEDFFNEGEEIFDGE